MKGTKYRPYEFAVLWVLKDTTGPVMLSEIYRRVKIYKTGEGKSFFPLKEEVEPEYAVRWALSNMGKPGRRLVKNSNPGLGLWEITEAGRASVDRDPGDLEEMD